MTATGSNCCGFGDRVPGIWSFSNSRRLHIRTGVNNNGNQGCDPTTQIPANKWTTVKIQVMSGSRISVWFDQQNVCTNTMGGNLYPSGKSVSLWAGDNWYPASNALVKNIKYSPLQYSTQEPTVEQFSVIILFSALTMEQVTPSLQTTYRNTLTSLLGVDDDSFNGQSPQETARNLSNYSPVQLSNYFGTTVSTVSIPESLNPPAPSPGGRGDSGGGNSTVVVVIVVVVLVVLAGACCALHLRFCRRGPQDRINPGIRLDQKQPQKSVVAQSVSPKPTAPSMPPGGAAMLDM
mmetsp:Transcript_4648/g.6171  ORF Transcript_4648/g.6171 Transcript_4648/m.6171 type:complete len:292 (-) Transcript_4648:152-1027(-)